MKNGRGSSKKKERSKGNGGNRDGVQQREFQIYHGKKNNQEKKR